MNSRHRNTLDRIFARQVPADLAWRDIETLLRALEATVAEGSGRRVRIELNGVVTVLHRPHPQPTAKKGMVRAVRVFLRNAGVEP